MCDNILGKKIGIWGYGVVGKSAYKLLSKYTDKIEVFDQNNLEDKNINQNFNLETFLNNDYIIVSPGIDTRKYRNSGINFLSEVDLFYKFYKGHIIALTGTVGKTTTVNLLQQILRKYRNITLGGNVGIPMLDLTGSCFPTTHKVTSDKRYTDFSELQKGEGDRPIISSDSVGMVSRDVILELSSFQLEYSEQFAPDLAILTNFSANHLDRHSTLEEYFSAKYNLFIYQNSDQKALVPLNLIDKFNILKPKSEIFYFAIEPKESEISKLKESDKLFYIKDGYLELMSHNSSKRIVDIKLIPELTYLENWLAICAASYLENIKLGEKDFKADFKIPEHRLERFANYKGAIFYNDSKSTVIESTLNAIKKINSENLLLILGGLSKGIDRSDLIKNCVRKVKKIYLFGKEADALKHFCDVYGISAEKFDNLENVTEQIFCDIKEGDQVLFSPAGSSYDLFKNYEERGKKFKELILEHINSV